MVKFKDFSRFLSVFYVLFMANSIFKDLSRQPCIFKYFSSLWEPGHNIFSYTIGNNDCKQFVSRSGPDLDPNYSQSAPAGIELSDQFFS